MLSNKSWYKFWMVVAFIDFAYLVFAIIPPTVWSGVWVGSICLITSLVLMWSAKG